MYSQQMNNVLSHINRVVVENGTKRKTLAPILGYRGRPTTQSTSVTNILTGKRDILISQLNNLAHFYRYPVGYFLFGDVNSIYQTINEEDIIIKITDLFIEEQKKERNERKAKFKLGQYIGYAGDQTSQLNTTNQILKGNRKIRVINIFAFADFFEKPVEWFL